MRNEELKMASGAAIIALVVEIGLGQQRVRAQIARKDAQRFLGVGDALGDLAGAVGPTGHVQI
jgi:hypothetical protein